MKNIFKKLIGTDKKKNDCCEIQIIEVKEEQPNHCCQTKEDCCETDNITDKNKSCCG